MRGKLRYFLLEKEKSAINQTNVHQGQTVEGKQVALTVSTRLCSEHIVILAQIMAHIVTLPYGIDMQRTEDNGLLNVSILQ